MPDNSSIACCRVLMSPEYGVVAASPPIVPGMLLKFPVRCVALKETHGTTALLPKNPRLSLWIYQRKLIPACKEWLPQTFVTLSTNCGVVTARAVCGEIQ